MANLLMGKPVADRIYEDVARRIALLPRAPHLAILRVGERADDLAYECAVARNCEKRGIAFSSIAIAASAETDEVLSSVEEINSDDHIDGLLLLRPLPAQLDETRIRNAIVEGKDLDCASDHSLGSLFTGHGHSFSPCTAEACIALLKSFGYPLAGANVVVVGRSLVVGKPLSMLLLRENATVTVCHSRTSHLDWVCRQADILIVAVGKPQLVDETFVRPGQIVLDVGIHALPNGGMCGDVDFDCVSPVVGAITPVPGGIGAVTSALLIEHAVCAAERRQYE